MKEVIPSKKNLDSSAKLAGDTIYEALHCIKHHYRHYCSIGQKRPLGILAVLTIFENLPVGRSGPYFRVFSTHGHYKTFKYGPDRPMGRFSKITKTTEMTFARFLTICSVPDSFQKVAIRLGCV